MVETLVFIHFSPSAIFYELPASSAEIRHRPEADGILKTSNPARDQGFESLPLRKTGKASRRPFGQEVPFLNTKENHMRIDFGAIPALTVPGMNGGTGDMTVRMVNDDQYRIIRTVIHPGGSIGMRTPRPPGTISTTSCPGQAKLSATERRKSCTPASCTSARRDRSTASPTREPR